MRAMNSHRRGLGLALAVLLMLAACGSDQQSGTPSASASASVEPSDSVQATPSATQPTMEPTPEPTPVPPTAATGTFGLLPASGPPGHTPGVSCSGRIGATDPVAVVHLKGPADQAEPIVLRNYADPANPRTVCEFNVGLVGETVEQLIDSRHVVIETCAGTYGCLFAVVDLPGGRYHWFDVPGEFIAVSPGLDEVAWVRGDDDYTHRRLILTRADGDHEGTHFRDVGGRCGTGDDSKQGAYSRGEQFYALDVPMPQLTVFTGYHGLERTFLMRRPRGGGWEWPMQPAMPVWSLIEDVLYYRLAGSVHRGTPAGGDELFLEGVHWQFPSFSPDGRYLVYAIPQDDGTHDTYLIDLRKGGAPELIAEERTQPVFLTATQLWYRAEKGQGCVAEQK